MDVWHVDGVVESSTCSTNPIIRPREPLPIAADDDNIDIFSLITGPPTKKPRIVAAPITDNDDGAGSGDPEESGDDFVAELAKIMGDHGDDDAEVIDDLKAQHDAKKRARAADEKHSGIDDNRIVSSEDEAPMPATYPKESFNVFLANLGLEDAVSFVHLQTSPKHRRRKIHKYLHPYRYTQRDPPSHTNMSVYSNEPPKEFLG